MSKKAIAPSAPNELAETLARMDRAHEAASRGLPSVEDDPEFILLGLKSDLVDQVARAMEADGLTRADLARRMNVSRAHVSAILNEAGNFQFETIAKLAAALGRDVALRLIRKTENVVVEPAMIRAVAAEREVGAGKVDSKRPGAPSLRSNKSEPSPGGTQVGVRRSKTASKPAKARTAPKS